MSPRRPIESSIRPSGGEGPGGVREALRAALADWVSGVTVVAVNDGERVHGMTVSAFAPLSLEPPLVMVSIDEQAPLLTYLDDAGRFTVNILAGGQKRAAAIFADRFPIGAELPPTGDPILPGALASLVCTLHDIHLAGDHRIVVGQVERVVRGPDEPPLVYYRRGYRALGGA